MTGGKFLNSIGLYRSATGGDFDHSFTGTDPLFRNPAAGDYRLLRTSPCVNAGSWMHPGDTRREVRSQTDLIGVCRLLGHDVDMGCCETISGFVIIAR